MQAYFLLRPIDPKKGTTCLADMISDVLIDSEYVCWESWWAIWPTFLHCVSSYMPPQTNAAAQRCKLAGSDVLIVNLRVGRHGRPCRQRGGISHKFVAPKPASYNLAHHPCQLRSMPHTDNTSVKLLSVDTQFWEQKRIYEEFQETIGIAGCQ